MSMHGRWQTAVCVFIAVLMDIMTDNEVEGVLGHEMGRVALGHVRKAIQVAFYAAVAARTRGLFSGEGSSLVVVPS